MPTDRSLSNVRWIGGGSGAGKTTIAQRFVAEFGGRVYHSDATMASHVAHLDRSHAPLLHEFLDMTMDERWLLRTPQRMLDTFHWYEGEGFDLVLDDLTAATATDTMVAEGFRLLPRLVAPLLEHRRAAVWLLPTPEFRLQALEDRGSLWTVPDRTSSPVRALDHLLERDRLFTERLRSETVELGLRSIEIGVDDAEDDVYEQVLDHFFASGVLG